MKRSRPRNSRLAAALALAVAFPGTVSAQEAPPEDIGTDLLDIARDAESAAGPEDRQVEDGRPFVSVPHELGGTEILPLPEGAIATYPDTDATGPGTQSVPHGGALPGSTVAEAASSGADALATMAGDASSVTAESGEMPESEVAANGRMKPRDLLQGLWREAVASGETAEGFEAWVSAALKPEQESPPSPEDQASISREGAVAWGRRTGPVALGHAGRVVTTYGQAIPVAHCSPLKVCYIELEPGEQLTDTPSVGDAVRWQVVPKIQGREPETVVLEIKPAQDAVETNIVIPTDRRLYSITLVNDFEYHTPILTFRWPDSEARAAAERIANRRAEENAVEEAHETEAAIRAEITAAELARSGVPTDAGPQTAELLDFRFRVSGEAPFRPVRVFADGTRTYIDLHPRYRGPLPAIVAGKAEGNAALNTRVSASGTRLVADRVISDVWLQSGKQRVRIRRISN